MGAEVSSDRSTSTMHGMGSSLYPSPLGQAHTSVSTTNGTTARCSRNMNTEIILDCMVSSVVSVNSQEYLCGSTHAQMIATLIGSTAGADSSITIKTVRDEQFYDKTIRETCLYYSSIYGGTRQVTLQ